MCLCIGHHALKTLTGWCPVAIGGGVIVWTSPAGRVYRKDPQHRMEPVPGLDIVSAGTNGTETGCTDAEVVDLRNAHDAAAGFAATPVWEVDLPAPLTRVTVRAGRPQRLFSDASADAYAQWLVSRDWTGADPNDDNNHVDPSEEGYVPPLDWEPDLSNPPPDPPIEAYFPNGVPVSVAIAMLEEQAAGRHTFEQDALDKELLRYAAIAAEAG